MFGIDLTTIGGLLILAANTVQCTVPQAPNIVINPTTAPIQYEFSLSSEQLGRFQSDTVNPYAPGVDTATGGLRHDRPRIKTDVKWGTLSYPNQQVSCLWYESINVSIELSPKIYVAKEHSQPACRNAIIEHEKRHVLVDREIINQYAQGIGQAVKAAVDGIGAMGPYNYHELDKVREQLVGHVRTAVDSQKFLLYQEMSRRQGEVDSLAEYERVNKICEEAENGYGR